MVPPALQHVLALLIAALWSTSAGAHDFWIEPSTFRPSPGETVAIGLRVGDDFIGDPVPHLSSVIDQFSVRQDGEVDTLTGADGLDPAAFFSATGHATTVVAYSSVGTFVELPADRFESNLKEYGLDAIVAERARRGESAEPGRETFYRYAKALLTGTSSSETATQPVPFLLEIVPDLDPTAQFGVFHARIFYEGDPLANARIEALLRTDPSVRLAAQSDARGAFSLALPRGGVWLIRSVCMVRGGLFSRGDWESSWASLTFEMPEKSR